MQSKLVDAWCIVDVVLTEVRKNRINGSLSWIVIEPDTENSWSFIARKRLATLWNSTSDPAFTFGCGVRLEGDVVVLPAMTRVADITGGA